MGDPSVLRHRRGRPRAPGSGRWSCRPWPGRTRGAIGYPLRDASISRAAALGARVATGRRTVPGHRPAAHHPGHPGHPGGFGRARRGAGPRERDRQRLAVPGRQRSALAHHPARPARWVGTPSRRGAPVRWIEGPGSWLATSVEDRGPGRSPGTAGMPTGGCSRMVRTASGSASRPGVGGSWSTDGRPRRRIDRRCRRPARSWWPSTRVTAAATRARPRAVLRRRTSTSTSRAGSRACSRHRASRSSMTRATDRDVNRPAVDVDGNGSIEHHDELVARLDVANLARADLTLNIHNNATACHCGSGTQTFVDSRRPWGSRSAALGRAVQRAMVRRLRAFQGGGWRVHDRGLGSGTYVSLGGGRIRRGATLPDACDPG